MNNKKIGYKKRRIQYQEKYKREFPRKWCHYCREPLELIDNWDKMLNDNSGQRWHLHHRDEILGDGVVVSRDELKNRGQYYNLAADRLIFLTEFEHHSLHNTGEMHPNYGRTGELSPKYGTNKYGITKEALHELYVVQRLSQKKIGKKFGCGQQLIGKYLKKFGIRKQAV